MPLRIFAIMDSVMTPVSSGALWQVAVGCLRTRPLRTNSCARSRILSKARRGPAYQDLPQAMPTDVRTTPGSSILECSSPNRRTRPMPGLAILVVAAAVCSSTPGALADGKIRLAQTTTPNVATPFTGLSSPVTSTVTNCMMSCNSQSANCQTSCVIPAPPLASPSGIVTLNATASQTCTAACSSSQLACQTNCARLSPSP